MKQYYVGIEDIFSVKAESQEEAESKVLAKLGEDGWICHNAQVVDVVPLEEDK